jgi:hypothetical protein
MVARCKVAGTAQEIPISFNSQPKAYRPSKMAMNPVLLRLTVQRDQAYNGSASQRISSYSWL